MNFESIKNFINPLRLSISIFSLEFRKDKYEKEFKEDLRERSLTLYILFAFLASFLFSVYYVLYDFLDKGWYLKMALASLIFGLSFYIKFIRRKQEIIKFLYSIFIYLNYLQRMFYYKSTETIQLAEHFFGIILILIAINTFLQLNFKLTVMLNTLFLLSYMVFNYIRDGIVLIEQEYFSYSYIIFISTIVVICISTYHNEYIFRHNFIQKKLIEYQSKKLQHSNNLIERKVQEKTKELESERIQKQKSLLTVQQQERERIAMDLHDILSIKLIVLKRKIESITRDEEILNELDQTIEKVREISHDILPYTLTKFGLIKAIEDLCITLQKGSNLNIRISKSGLVENLRWEKTIETETFKAIQEIVTNCIKHSRAKHLLIDMVADPKNLFLNFEDDGIGFKYSDIQGNSSGINNIETRIHLLGGTVNYDSQIGKGTIVMLKIPLSNPA